MKYFPLFFKLNQSRTLVVGGGEIAYRKVHLLLKAEANIHLIAPTLCEELADLVADNKLTHQAKLFEPTDLKDISFVVSATDDETVNKQVAEAAETKKLPINVVDSPELCSVIFPAIVERDPVTIAISSSGEAPVLARLIRARIESFIPTQVGQLARLIGQFRDKVKKKFSNVNQRKAFWEHVLQGPVAEQMYAGHEQKAKKLLSESIKSNDDSYTQGEVYLVGAGPGDPDLLTFRALRLMQQADVVVYDRLVSDDILELTRRDAKRLYVGKKAKEHVVSQAEINQALVDYAKQGHKVLRLKGGDPFTFGRGGEEIETLAQQGVLFQVVPGVSAANGCAAYSGIPLTHRDYAQSVMFVTGHLKEGRCDLNWEKLTHPNQTLVIYMGIMGVETITRGLIKAGVKKYLPAAIVQEGTTSKQKVFTGELQDLPHMVETNHIKSPALIILGDVVLLRDKLNWFN